MKRSFKKVVSIMLTILMVMSCVAVAASARKEEYVPSIVIPGIFQSEVKLYNKDGSLALNRYGEEYEAPFFLDSTVEIVMDAAINALVPIASLLINQEDKDKMAANELSRVAGEIVFGKTLGVDSNGEFLYDVKATKYDTSIAQCSAYDQDYVYDQIPLYQYSEIAGAENLFFFSYYSFGSVIDTVDALDKFIYSVMEQTGSDKVNIVPISQGGTLANALLAYDEEIMAHLNRIVYIVPALDGANLVGQLYADGLADDDSMLYLEMFPKLFGEDQQWLAYLVDMILRIMPNADVNNIIDTVVDGLVGDYLKRSTLMWALCPSGYYPAAAEKYLSGEENAKYKKETDWYYNEAQLKSDENILKAKNDYDVEIFDIVDYNSEVYALTEGYNDQNGDGIIHLDSTSMGATSFGVDVELPEGYVLQHTNCSEPTHNHTDPWNLIDCTTGLLPDTTFYFKDQNHERTARNDVIIKLATRILVDQSFNDVYSDTNFPQFNYGRLSRDAERAVEAAGKVDRTKLTAAQAKELDDAVAVTQGILDTTVVTEELNVQLDASVENIYAIIAKINNGGVEPDNSEEEQKEKTTNFFLNILSRIFRFFTTIFTKMFGGKGFSEI